MYLLYSYLFHLLYIGVDNWHPTSFITISSVYFYQAAIDEWIVNTESKCIYNLGDSCKSMNCSLFAYVLFYFL